jgi:hypothetical protein
MEGQREESAAKYVRVNIEPSARVQPGIYVATNEHYEEPEDDGTARLVGYLERNWGDAQAYAEAVARHLLRLVE